MPPVNKIEQYDKLVAVFPDIERKGKTTPYTAVNGNMFSFLDKEGNLGLRLDKEERGAFIEKFETTLMEQHGRVMKEYVLVPSSLLDETNQLTTYFKLSINYVLSLKPKPSQKKKK